MISSMVINNLLLNNFSKNTQQAEYRLNELEYKIQNREINLPYEEVYEGWEISVKKQKFQTKEGLILSATYKNKIVSKKRMNVEK